MWTMKTMLVKVTTLLPFMMLLCGADMYSLWDVECPANNISAELQLLPPLEYDVPQSYVFVPSLRPVNLFCCATGFSFFTWYKDGVELQQSQYYIYEYINETTREQLLWYSLNISDCSQNKYTTFYECVFTCEAHSVDKLQSVSQDIVVSLPSYLSSSIANIVPEFVEAKAEECLNEGQDLHIHCRLLYEQDIPNYPKTISVTYGNGTALNNKMPNTEEAYENLISDDVSYNVTVKNVSTKMLNQNFTCRSKTHHHVSRSFHIAVCQSEIKVTMVYIAESKVSIMVAIPVAAIALLTAIALILLVRFNVYANLWYKVHILQRFHSDSGDFKYDAYLIYKDPAQPVVLQSMNLLESEHNLNLCVPERDFTIGSVTPNSISESLHASHKVVVFLSNEMFEKGRKAHDWSDVSLSLALALNKKVIIFLLEDIDSTSMKGRNEVKAALKVIKCGRIYPDDDEKMLAAKLATRFAKKSK